MSKLSHASMRRRRVELRVFAALLFCLSSLAAAQSPTAGGAPVRLDGKELFRIHHAFGTLSASDRAAAATDTLDDLALNPFRPAGELELRSFESHTELLYGDRILMAVTDEDAATEGLDRQQLAADRLALVRAEVESRRAIYWQPRSLLIGLLYTVLFTAAFWVALRYVRRPIARAIDDTLDGSGPIGKRLAWLDRRTIFARLKVRHALARALGVVRTLLTLAASGLYLFVVLSFFPRTKYVARALLEQLLAVLATAWSAFVGYVPNLLFLVVIGVVTYYAIRLTRFFFSEVERGSIALPSFEADWAQPTSKIVTVLAVALAVVMAFPYIPGSQSAAFQGVSLFLGLLISLSASSAISNVIAGVILTYTGAFRIGDRVGIADTTGDVVEKTLLVTRVRTIKNLDIAIPNALVLTSHIVNYSRVARTDGVILHTSITIGYDAPWRTVHELLLAAAGSTVDVLEDPRPFVLQSALNDFHVSYELNVYTRNPWRMGAIYSELHQNIQDRFNEAGVEIMSPHYASIRDGNQVTIPERYVPPTYTAPAFRFLPSTPRAKARSRGDGQ